MPPFHTLPHIHTHPHSFTDLCRVGSARRADPRLEPYLFLASEGPNTNTNSGGAAVSPSHQLRRLRAARVVGVTCASCPSLQGGLVMGVSVYLV